MPIKSGIANPVDVSHYSSKLENMILSGKRKVMILRRAHPILFIYSQRIDYGDLQLCRKIRWTLGR